LKFKARVCIKEKRKFMSDVGPTIAAAVSFSMRILEISVFKKRTV
jgi:hypothetical protein